MIRWRSMIAYTAIMLPVMAVLLLCLLWLGSFASAGQILLLLLLTTLLLGLLVTMWSERKLRPIRQLNSLAQGGANTDELLLLETDGEFGSLIRFFRRNIEKRHQIAKKRHREKDRLLTILQYMADGVMILNKDGKVRLLNPAAERILSTSQTKARNRTFIQVARDHRIAALWQRCLESEQEETALVDFDNDRFLRVVVTPFLQKSARGYVTILQDLTHIHHLQTVRQDFVSNVSHELRTPLASLRALAETLNDGALEDPPTARRFLLRMETEVDALTQLVQELMELSRIESGQTPLEIHPCAVSDVVQQPVERLQPQAERAQVELLSDIDDNLPLVLVDLARIRQVTMNLVHNAIKFTPPGGSICVGASADGDFVTIRVQDTGAGINKEDLPRIFERFYKSDRSRAGSGTGLGLAIAKHTVQAHNGRIWAESMEGRGSTFYFALPIAQPVEV
ncbi:MAG: PAS domain-containing protein [Caldilineaceae bacterium]|nr:PAS domain-containing protein [Caldilineaceae bacterium]